MPPTRAITMDEMALFLLPAYTHTPKQANIIDSTASKTANSPS